MYSSWLDTFASNLNCLCFKHTFSKAKKKSLLRLSCPSVCMQKCHNTWESFKARSCGMLGLLPPLRSYTEGVKLNQVGSCWNVHIYIHRLCGHFPTCWLYPSVLTRSSYSEVEVRDYLWQILSAVEYLHAQNILHLDLRSENMIITEPNLLKLLDFGNAQFYVPDRVITLDRCTDYVETMGE